MFTSKCKNPIIYLKISFPSADYREMMHIKENVPPAREEVSTNSLLQDKGKKIRQYNMFNLSTSAVKYTIHNSVKSFLSTTRVFFWAESFERQLRRARNYVPHEFELSAAQRLSIFINGIECNK